MRIGMDISQLAHQGGVATYTNNLSNVLSKNPDLEMVYFYSSLRKPYIGGLKNVKSYRFPPMLFELLFNKLRNIPIERFLGPIDVFHSSDWAQPPSRAKKVTTYHDIVPIKYPQWSHPKIVAVHKRRLKLVEQEIDHVIAVSESTKKDLLEVSNIPEHKITVIYEGPTMNFKPQPEEKIRQFREKYQLPETFVLAIGGVGERRNMDRIKEAAKGYNLVVTGQTIPYLALDELNQLYQSATVLIYASLYEGFGLPILDAFSVGLPVITSNVSSMPEMAGGAAAFVNPLKVEEIKQKLDQVMGDEVLRNELRRKGFKRAKEFSWEKCANQIIGVYSKLVK